MGQTWLCHQTHEQTYLCPRAVCLKPVLGHNYSPSRAHKKQEQHRTTWLTVSTNTHWIGAPVRSRGSRPPGMRTPTYTGTSTLFRPPDISCAPVAWVPRTDMTRFQLPSSVHLCQFSLHIEVKCNSKSNYLATCPWGGGSSTSLRVSTTSASDKEAVVTALGLCHTPEPPAAPWAASASQH